MVVQLREAADEPSPVYGVPSLGPSDQEVVEEDRKDYKWQHPRTPSARRLWAEGATEAVLEFLWDTRVGCRVSSGRVRVEEVKGVEGVLLSEGEEGGPGPP